MSDSGFMKEFMNGVIKKFEIFKTFFNDEDNNLDYKTRLDESEIDDIAFLHVLHKYMNDNWGYDSPIYNILQRKKSLRVSRDGRGRLEMENILRGNVEDKQDDRSKWDRLMGTS